METTAGELRLARRIPSKDPVLGEGSMELEFMRRGASSRRGSSKSLTPKGSKDAALGQSRPAFLTPRASKEGGFRPALTPKASKESPGETETADGGNGSADLPESAAAAKLLDAAEGSEEGSAGSQSTEPQFNLARTYAVTLYSSELSSFSFDKPQVAQRTKARNFAVNLQNVQKDAGFSSNDATPPPPGASAARRRSVDFDFSSEKSTPRSNAARPTTKFHVWTDSEMLNVKTPEIASQDGDAQAFIKVAFKPHSQPRRTREFVFIQEAGSKVPVEALGFDLEYI